uniref:Uncharacterized protein n=1 Tax=Anguilla anguilla TaxID=7936 RepID=A0A0E9WYX3_ANGAN
MHINTVQTFYRQIYGHAVAHKHTHTQTYAHMRTHAHTHTHTHKHSRAQDSVCMGGLMGQAHTGFLFL